MNPTGRYAHKFEEEEKRKFIETTTEILIKKKLFFPLEGSILSLPSRMTT
jgi:hypothetical protein